MESMDSPKERAASALSLCVSEGGDSRLSLPAWRTASRGGSGDGSPLANAPAVRKSAPAHSPPEPDSATNWDRLLRAWKGRLTSGLSPVGLALVYADWLLHLGVSPGKQIDLVRKSLRKGLRFSAFAARASLLGETSPAIEPLPQDRRFDDPAWQQYPFNLYYQSFLLVQQWLHNATTGVRGVSRHDEEVVTFVGRQLLDICAD